MGIFTNFDVEPKLYKSEFIFGGSTNQESFRLNYLQDVISKQNQLNQLLSHSVDHTNQILEKSTLDHNNQFQYVLQELIKQNEITKAFKEALEKQDTTNELILERISQLEKNNELLAKKLNSEKLVTQAILDQQSYQDSYLQKLTSKMDQSESNSNRLTSQLEKQEEFYEDLANKLQLQEVFHNTVMERLDQQEGLIRKIGLEIDHLRTIIFERTNHLVEKFETSFNKFVQPVQRFFISRKEEEAKENENVHQ